MPTEMTVTRDGRSWQLGSPADVAWIAASTTVDRTVTSAVPALYDTYATVELPRREDNQDQHDDALLCILQVNSRTSRWWLGYLDTGADDIVFPDAPRVVLYTGWSYVLVLAGPDQARTWRTPRPGSFWAGRLPNLMFPDDRSWLASTLWDDNWTCIGGPNVIIEALRRDPALGIRSRQVSLTQK